MGRFDHSLCSWVTYKMSRWNITYFLLKCFLIHFLYLRIRSSTRWTIIPEIFGVHHSEVLKRSFAFADAMCTIGITHHLEHLSVLHQLIDQHFSILIVNVV